VAKGMEEGMELEGGGVCANEGHGIASSTSNHWIFAGFFAWYVITSHNKKIGKLQRFRCSAC